MYGANNTDGIMKKTIDLLLQKSQSISVSMIEIFGTEKFDLIHRTEKKKITPAHELTCEQIDSAEKFNKCVNKALLRRIQKPTNQNQNSSRSHAVTLIYLNDKKHMLFVDLAGFENPKGKDIKEAKFINSSLSGINTALLQLSRGFLPTFTGNPMLMFLKPYIKDLNCSTIMFYHIRRDYLDQGLRYIKDIAAKTETKNQKT